MNFFHKDSRDRINYYFTNKFDESLQTSEEQEPKDTDIDEAASKREQYIIEPVTVKRGYPPYSPELYSIGQF
ncbi:hypothetical protein INT47_011271 [Mucor saturninus]|uniref:Uncharacterized protein n=1 Tax=Mucor saturninus TaxID=64648 RepID=A0A8H7RL95_9FUNG|nr:hypothetical protein INT47_011271 [Mucor saturninus]